MKLIRLLIEAGAVVEARKDDYGDITVKVWAHGQFGQGTGQTYTSAAVMAVMMALKER